MKNKTKKFKLSSLVVAVLIFAIMLPCFMFLTACEDNEGENNNNNKPGIPQGNQELRDNIDYSKVYSTQESDNLTNGICWKIKFINENILEAAYLETLPKEGTTVKKYNNQSYEIINSEIKFTNITSTSPLNNVVIYYDAGFHIQDKRFPVAKTFELYASPVKTMQDFVGRYHSTIVDTTCVNNSNILYPGDASIALLDIKKYGNDYRAYFTKGYTPTTNTGASLLGIFKVDVFFDTISFSSAGYNSTFFPELCTIKNNKFKMLLKESINGNTFLTQSTFGRSDITATTYYETSVKKYINNALIFTTVEEKFILVLLSDGKFAISQNNTVVPSYKTATGTYQISQTNEISLFFNNAMTVAEQGFVFNVGELENNGESLKFFFGSSGGTGFETYEEWGIFVKK